MRVIYSESEEAAASSASMLGTPVVHSSLPPPSLPSPSIPSSLLSPFFQTTSNAVTVCKPEGAKAEEKRTGECSSNISSQSVWWFMHYQDSFKVWFKMECLNSWICCWGIKCEVEESNVIRLVFLPLQLPPVQSQDSETVRAKLPSVLHSPTSHHHHLSGGLGSMGLSATVRERLRSKLQKAQVRSHYLCVGKRWKPSLYRRYLKWALYFFFFSGS